MAPITLEPPFYPLIYVRGYAGTQQDVEDTVADPFMGFNLGSSKIRQRWTGKVERFYFESPFIRLMQDVGYTSTFHGDRDMPLEGELRPRAVFIYRYYDATSSDFGTGQRLSIEDAARGLSDLILRIREMYCGTDPTALAAFKVLILAHSMGGLICRCFLQNLNVSDPAARQCVDKVFTYATPHNGIDFDALGNVPGFVSLNDANNFNRSRIAEYLALPKGTADVSTLAGKFDPNRFFNLVGTNDRDYEVAATLSRRLVGPMSDGLVRIANATTWGSKLNEPGKTVNSPRAFVHRSHSGYYGIVNSEEGFQNLYRFLFGNIRVDGKLVVNSIALPAEIEEMRAAGRVIRASYHIEVVLRVRGQPWDLHRRTVNENSAIFRKFDALVSNNDDERRDPTLFSLFLATQCRINQQDPSLGFSLDLGVVVPEYEVDGVLWLKQHYAGGYLFRHKINFTAIPPSSNAADWSVRYGFDVDSPNDTTTDATLSRNATTGGVTFSIPIVQKTSPGINAQLVVTAASWK